MAVEYVKLCGLKHGGDRKSKDQDGLLNLSDIAKQLGTSQTSLKRAIARLSKQKQEELLSELNAEKK